MLMMPLCVSPAVYLSVLRPVLGGVLYWGSLVGAWGFTVQLALFQDILATLTLHIYCFYVYAARYVPLNIRLLLVDNRCVTIMFCAVHWLSALLYFFLV